MADEQGVPAFVVFSDATLLEMVRVRPATLDEMPGLIETLLGTHQGRLRLQEIHENCRKLMREIDAGEGLAATW